MSPSPDLPPLSNLLPRLATGDHVAFTTLVRHSTARLLGYALRLTNDEGLAEDIVQDVWCWVWDHREAVGAASELGNDDALEKYLRRAVYHRMIDRRRADRAREARGTRFVAASEESYQENSAASQLEHAELVQAMSNAIAALPERRRDIILRRWSMQTTREIAEALGISVKTVEAQITSAYASLRETLQRFVANS